jgi:hypothetical protein
MVETARMMVKQLRMRDKTAAILGSSCFLKFDENVLEGMNN